MKRILFLSLAAAATIAVFAPEPADASRRVIDLTDSETKAYCRANPDNCETKIHWGGTAFGLVGLPLIIGFFRSAIGGGD